MARNRKYQTTATRFGPALKAFLLCLLIGGSGVGYVWQKAQILELGKQMLKREQRLAELTAQNDDLKEKLNKMRQPKELQKRIVEMKLGLAQPQQAQWLRLTEPARESSPGRGQSSLLSARDAERGGGLTPAPGTP